MSTGNSSSRIRIIGAIAAKDMLDALRNKTLMGVALGVVVLVLNTMAFPLLAGLDDRPRLTVHDPGRSQFVADLRRSRAVRLFKVGSPEGVVSDIGQSDGASLGISLPADIDERIAAESEIELDAVHVHWLSHAKVAEMEAGLGQVFSQRTGKHVVVSAQGNEVYPPADSTGYPFMVAMGVVVAIVTICTATVPQLIVEEKETHTMDALLISPATIWEVSLGKGLAGMTYGLIAGCCVLALHYRALVNWPVALLGAAVGSFFAAALGLLLGSVTRDAQRAGILMGFPIAVLLFPIFFTQFGRDGWPHWLTQVADLLPSLALARVTTSALAQSADLSALAGNLGIMIAWGAVFLAGVVVVLRRSDR